MTPEPRTTALEARPAAAFIRQLHRLAHRAEQGDGTGRAGLARLRRTLSGRTLTYNGLSEIGDWLPQDLYDTDLETYLLVAALFSLNPSGSTDSGESFGATLRRLRNAISTGAESLDRRVSALVDAGIEDLPFVLRQLVQQLDSKNLAPNYYRLLDDLLAWDHPNRHVQRLWAKDYWVG